ncbi:MAG: hypothetical protein RR619_12300, partial [Raoultibacter sp.]
MTVKKMCVAACFVVVFLPMVLGGCASQGKSGSDSANDGAELTAWSLETDCSVCHAVESASADDSACL